MARTRNLAAFGGGVQAPCLPWHALANVGFSLMQTLVKGTLSMFLVGSLTFACQHDKQAQGPMERAGKSVDHAAQKTGQALETAAKKTGAAAERAAGATGEALQKAGKKLKGKAPSARAGKKPE
jgi:hypothetical protein